MKPIFIVQNYVVLELTKRRKYEIKEENIQYDHKTLGMYVSVKFTSPNSQGYHTSCFAHIPKPYTT